MFRRLLALLPACCLLPAAASAGVVRVTPDLDHLQVQDIMDRAEYGDTVLVAPGEYLMIYVRNGITLLGEEGPEKTIFRHGGGDVVIANQTDSTTVIEGITIDGHKASPGLLVVEECQTRIRNCIIKNATVGIRATFSDLLIEDVRVERCLTGIYLYETQGTVSNVTVTRCRKGLTIVNAKPQIIRSTFMGNSLGISVEEHSVPVIGGSLENANRFFGNPGGDIKSTLLRRERGA